MRVLIYAPGSDTGGQGYRIADAFARHEPNWTVDAVSVNPNASFQYPGKQPGSNHTRRLLARDLYQRADVVHLRHYLRAWEQWDHGARKPVVLHYHGSDLRVGRGSSLKDAHSIGATVIVSTLDLTLIAPGIHWLPSPYNVDRLHAKRDLSPHDRIRIAYFPTAGVIKSVGPFMAAIRALKERHDIELLTNVRGQDRIMHVSWREVLRAKAKADIYFDQVKLGYGNNAVEAWCMGLPVVAGTDDPAIRDLMLARFGTLPYVEATEQTIEPVLERLIQSRAMRQEWGQRGLAHVRRWHDDRRVVDQLKALYSEARPTKARVISDRSPRIWRRPAAA